MKTTWVVASVAFIVITGCAGKRARTEAPVPPPVAETSMRQTPRGVVSEGVVTIAARVEAVDLERRVVTLRGPDGNVVDVEVGDEVRNLPQVRKGDEVIATYRESVAISVLKPGEAKAGITTTETGGRAELGEKPAARHAHETKVTATVVGVNKRNSTLTVKGPRGKTVTAQLDDPARLENVKVGDLVEVVYTEAVAISVEKPATAKKH